MNMIIRFRRLGKCLERRVGSMARGSRAQTRIAFGNEFVRVGVYSVPPVVGHYPVDRFLNGLMACEGWTVCQCYDVLAETVWDDNKQLVVMYFIQGVIYDCQEVLITIDKW